MMVLPVLAEVNSVKGPPQGQWTYADWETLPDDGNLYEVIEGVLYMSTSPSYFHNWIIRRFDRLLGQPAEELGLAYCGLERVGVFMPGAEPVQPDYVVVLAEHAAIIRDKRSWGVPELIAEVLSPGSTDYDEVIKLEAYAKAGVPEYVVIDPSVKQVRVYKVLQPGSYAPPMVYKEGDTITFACLPTLPVEVNKLF